jgi:hypothetical protein
VFFAFNNVVASRRGFVIRIGWKEVIRIGLYSGLFRFLRLGFGLYGWVARLGGFIGVGRSDRDSLVLSLSSFGFLTYISAV